MHTIMEISKTAIHFAVVGFGPKGLYAFERLLAEIKMAHLEYPITIHLFNKNIHFGAGDIYRTDQPDYLKMNYANRFITLWNIEGTPPILTDALRFSDWLMLHGEYSYDQIDNQCESRATVGTYLEFYFNQLCDHLPNHVTVEKHIQTVYNIHQSGNQHFLEVHGADGDTVLPMPFSYIMLTTGHSEICCDAISRASKNSEIPFIYPVEKQLAHINAGAQVAIKGFGLTAIDAILALTEGKGGYFISNNNQELIYTPSGLEVDKIAVYSTSGYPMIPRATSINPSSEGYPSYFEAYAESILARKHRNPLDFESELLPLIQQDIQFTYYRVVFEKYGQVLEYKNNFDEVLHQISNFHIQNPHLPIFSSNSILHPSFDVTYGMHTGIEHYLRSTLQEISSTLSPFAVAASVWRRISNTFNTIYQFGGLLPHSQKKFDTYYFGLFNRVSYGPPDTNMKKILALSECGILDFTFIKNPEVLRIDNTFRLINHEELKSETFQFHIDARIPRSSTENMGRLYSNLCASGLAKPYRNFITGASYETGGIAINHEGNIIDNNGNPNKKISVYGTPTEGITFDNDTLSRNRNDFGSVWAKNSIQHLEISTKRSLENKGVDLETNHSI